MWTRLVEFFRRWPGWVALGVLLAVLLALIIYRLALPQEIRLATAMPGGLYYDLGTKLAPLVAGRSGRQVELLETRGTVENIGLLKSGGAHLAILQAGAGEMDGIAAIAPLYPDVVHIIVRKSANITSIHELAGRSIALGPEGSGMRSSAMVILGHFDIDPAGITGNERYFGELLADASLEGAIVTSGMLNPDLNRVMGTGEFDLLSIRDATAVSLHHPYFTGLVISRGTYGENPLVPPDPVPTVATTAFLATTTEQKPFMVRAAIQAVYEDYPSRGTPTLIAMAEAGKWLPVPLHRSAHAYLRPFEGLGVVTNVMESLVATKELLFALGAGLYLLWLRVRAVKRRRHELRLKQEHARLDALLNETVRIERAQMGKNSAEELSAYLDEVTELKLTALEELTHEDMRGDVRFSIFLMQCANLIRKIQGKLAMKM